MPKLLTKTLAIGIFRVFTNIPVTNVLVKGCCTKKHMTHISHLTNIPTANVLIKGGCIKKCFLCIVVGNTNTTIAKNTTKISNLKDQIDINTDLTHWDVSHASDAQKAFFNAATYNGVLSLTYFGK
jgi:hypothetical protein